MDTPLLISAKELRIATRRLLLLSTSDYWKGSTIGGPFETHLCNSDRTYVITRKLYWYLQDYQNILACRDEGERKRQHKLSSYTTRVRTLANWLNLPADSMDASSLCLSDPRLWLRVDGDLITVEIHRRSDSAVDNAQSLIEEYWLQRNFIVKAHLWGDGILCKRRHLFLAPENPGAIRTADIEQILTESRRLLAGYSSEHFRLTGASLLHRGWLELMQTLDFDFYAHGCTQLGGYAESWLRDVVFLLKIKTRQHLMVRDVVAMREVLDFAVFYLCLASHKKAFLNREDLYAFMATHEKIAHLLDLSNLQDVFARLDDSLSKLKQPPSAATVVG